MSVGIDGDPHALRRQGDLQWRVNGNIERLPFRDSTFDLVTANMVVEHIEHPKEFFAEIARVLAPGGRFIMHTPNASGYTTLLTRLVPARLRPWLASRLQGRAAADVYTTFYRSNSPRRLRRHAHGSDLTLRRLEQLNSSPQLASIASLAVLERQLLRLLSVPSLCWLRACLIAQLDKTPSSPQ
jgi:2-polyprenyl-3-methyl-5-hydroxy-6-metoxy-1,4-benzoquinol methylase